jgi:hypothetical protein
MSGLLFRANASNPEKAFTLVAIGTCLLAIYGLVYEFSPSPGVKKVAGYGAALCGLLFTIAVLRDRHPGNRFRAFGPMKKVWFSTLLFLFSYGFSWAAIGLGLASVGNAAIGEIAISRARVIAIPNPNYGKGCKFAFSIRYVLASEATHRMCASEAYWASLRTGQEISVVQRRSVLGTDVVGFRNDS